MENKGDSSLKNVALGNSTKENIFLVKQVDNSCVKPIRIIFDTLFNQKKVRQIDLANFLGVDKAYVCRIVNGSQYPELRIRLKIAEFFGVDSALIWEVSN